MNGNEATTDDIGGSDGAIGRRGPLPLRAQGSLFYASDDQRRLARFGLSLRPFAGFACNG
jgi:hypothetical protein